MKRQFTLKIRKAKSHNRGYTLIELAIVIAIMGIMGMLGVTSIAFTDQNLLRSGESLATDLESCMAMTQYGPNSYSIAFERDGYTVLKNRRESIEMEKKIIYPKGIAFERIPEKISFLKKGDLELKKQDRTIKIVDIKRNESIYITIVPVSNRVRVTESPSKPF